MMDTIIDTYRKTGTLHHAYLCEGEKENVFPTLCDMLEKELDFPTKGNPDFWHAEFETFGIDDGRGIKELQTRKAIVHERKVFVIITKSFTTEAQNSLLKVFEEPTEGTHFFIITPNAEILLPTLRSRMLIISKRAALFGGKKGPPFFGVDVGEFLKSSKARRMELLKDVIEKKDKNMALSFLNELEQLLYKNFGSERNEYLEALNEIIKCKKYLSGRSPSVKMILEHVALITP